jgi:hypothetical protein
MMRTATLRVLAQHLVEARAVDRDDSHFRRRDGVGGARHCFEQGHLAEEVALLQPREDVRLAADVLDDLDLALLDDEHLGAELALREDALAGGIRELRILERIFAGSAGRLEHCLHAS